MLSHRSPAVSHGSPLFFSLSFPARAESSFRAALFVQRAETRSAGRDPAPIKRPRRTVTFQTMIHPSLERRRGVSDRRIAGGDPAVRDKLVPTFGGRTSLISEKRQSFRTYSSAPEEETPTSFKINAPSVRTMTLPPPFKPSRQRYSINFNVYFDKLAILYSFISTYDLRTRRRDNAASSEGTFITARSRTT